MVSESDDRDVDSAEDSERRMRAVAVPVDYSDYMTVDQRITLHSMSNFGWKIAFIRRPIAKAPIIVLKSPSNTYAQLQDNGSLDSPPQLIIRD